MAKVQTTSEFESTARSVVAQKQAGIDKLNASVADAERKLAEFAAHPVLESFEEAVQLESQLVARKSLAKKLTLAFNPDREFESLVNVAEAKPVLLAYAESKKSVLGTLRSQIAKLRKKAAQREEAQDPEHFDISDQADDIAGALESYENSLKVFAGHIELFPQNLDSNVNYVTLRNRIDEIV